MLKEGKRQMEIRGVSLVLVKILLPGDSILASLRQLCKRKGTIPLGESATAVLLAKIPPLI